MAVILEPLKNARLSGDGQIKDVRGDHRGRYEWAAKRVSGVVVDAGCNSGYGSFILADGASIVLGLDNWPAGLNYADANWKKLNTFFAFADLEKLHSLTGVNCVVAFEVIEHLPYPERFLAAARGAERLFASVPNENKWRWTERLWPVHQRHYTPEQLAELLESTGWKIERWWGQETAHSSVEAGIEGRTLVVECR